ncbi:MAG: hypothetical protein Q8L90_14140 [Bacteroidota bacterium]|nr:hypothetical protein [Bacteroidota bacterium]
METKNLFKYLMVVATVGVLFTACKKEKDEPADTDTTGAADNALAESSFNDASNISDQAAAGNLTSYLAANNGSDERGLLSACATITHDTTTSPRTIIVDFGTTNCLCSDGRYRKGIINISYSGHYKDSASTHTITFTNFFVNDNQVTGSHSVTNNGHNNNGHLTFTIAVTGTIIKANSGGVISWTSNRVREWSEGESTAIWSDDVYLITGTASGSHSNGNSFTATITSALKIKMNCHNIVSGGLDLTPSGKPTRSIDWGNGTCDNQATVTINGHVYNITLH